MGLPDSYFCTQKCFKEYWPIHKYAHKKKNIKKDKFEGFKFTGPLRPGKVTPMRFVPDDINKPDYFFTGMPHEEIESKYQKEIPMNSEE